MAKMTGNMEYPKQHKLFTMSLSKTEIERDMKQTVRGIKVMSTTNLSQIEPQAGVDIGQCTVTEVGWRNRIFRLASFTYRHLPYRWSLMSRLGGADWKTAFSRV